MKNPTPHTLALLGGPGGIGKSTLLRQLAQSGDHIRCRFLSAELNNLSLQVHERPLRELDLHERDALRERHASLLASSLPTEEGVTVLDCHYADATGDISKCIQPDTLLERVHLLLFADAPTATILHRRLHDTGRERTQDANHVDMERAGELQAAKELSVRFGLPLVEVNLDGDFDSCVQQILSRLPSPAIS